MDDERRRFGAAVLTRVTRKLRADEAAGEPVSLGLGVFGVIGWSVTTPTVAGALLGAWIDKHHPGSRSWTLALLVTGLALGCANAWYWVAAQTAVIEREPGDHE